MTGLHTFSAHQIHPGDLLAGAESFGVCLYHCLHHLSMSQWQDQVVPFIVLPNWLEKIKIQEDYTAVVSACKFGRGNPGG